MSENNCDPNIIIKPEDSNPKQLENLDIISPNRQILISPASSIVVPVEQQIPSRQPQTEEVSSTSSSSQQSQSRPTSSPNGSGSSASSESQKIKPCSPTKAKIGGWNMPMTSYGKVKGIPIQPREINCDCYGN